MHTRKSIPEVWIAFLLRLVTASPTSIPAISLPTAGPAVGTLVATTAVGSPDLSPTPVPTLLQVEAADTLGYKQNQRVAGQPDVALCAYWDNECGSDPQTKDCVHNYDYAYVRNLRDFSNTGYLAIKSFKIIGNAPSEYDRVMIWDDSGDAFTLPGPPPQLNQRTSLSADNGEEIAAIKSTGTGQIMQMSIISCDPSQRASNADWAAHHC